MLRLILFFYFLLTCRQLILKTSTYGVPLLIAKVFVSVEDVYLKGQNIMKSKQSLCGIIQLTETAQSHSQIQ